MNESDVNTQKLKDSHSPQVEAKVYVKHAFHPLRIESITEQLRQICYAGYNNILEVGVGKGLLKHFLKPFPPVSHTSLDIAEDLHPDYIGSVTDMPFENGQFELTVCCEVLEHLPFEDFLPALKEIHRVTKHRAILSLPDTRRRFGIAVCFFRFGWFKKEFNFIRRKFGYKKFAFDGEHYWEIGCKGTRIKEVVDKIHKAGFNIERQYRLEKQEWHCFFILRP